MTPDRATPITPEQSVPLAHRTALLRLPHRIRRRSRPRWRAVRLERPGLRRPVRDAAPCRGPAAQRDRCALRPRRLLRQAACHLAGGCRDPQRTISGARHRDDLTPAARGQGADAGPSRRGPVVRILASPVRQEVRRALGEPPAPSVPARKRRPRPSRGDHGQPRPIPKPDRPSRDDHPPPHGESLRRAADPRRPDRSRSPSLVHETSRFAQVLAQRPRH